MQVVVEVEQELQTMLLHKIMREMVVLVAVDMDRKINLERVEQQGQQILEVVEVVQVLTLEDASLYQEMHLLVDQELLKLKN
jgi:hypothetical protein